MSCFLCSHPVTTATYTLSLHDALPITPGAAAVQEASFARDPIASRRGRRITRRVCYPIVRIGQLGVVAPNKRNRGRRDANVEIGRLEPLLSRPGPSFDRTRHAGHMVG